MVVRAPSSALRYVMDLLRYVKLRLRMHREYRKRFHRHRLQSKPLVSDPGMNHGTCGTHVPWCMSGSLTRGGLENVPAHVQHVTLRIWQEAHVPLQQTILNTKTRSLIRWPLGYVATVCGSYLKNAVCDIFYIIMLWSFLVKLFGCECHGSILMIHQNGFRLGEVRPLPEPSLPQTNAFIKYSLGHN